MGLQSSPAFPVRTERNAPRASTSPPCARAASPPLPLAFRRTGRRPRRGAPPSQPSRCGQDTHTWRRPSFTGRAPRPRPPPQQTLPISCNSDILFYVKTVTSYVLWLFGVASEVQSSPAKFTEAVCGCCCPPTPASLLSSRVPRDPGPPLRDDWVGSAEQTQQGAGCALTMTTKCTRCEP